MAIAVINHTGRKIYIYDDTRSQFLAETTVMAHDKMQNTISIRNSVLRDYAAEQLSLLILYENEVYECLGRIIKSLAVGMIDIALFQGRANNKRSATRYDINAPGRVESLLVANQPVALRNPFDVFVINLSATGVLVRSPAGLLKVGSSFQLKLNFSGEETLLNAQVARIVPLASGEIECGCRF